MSALLGLEARRSIHKIKDETLYYRHQIDGIRLLANRPSFLLADEMGLGKSLSALTVAAIDFERGRAKRVLVVAPASLKWNWVAEIDKFTNFTRFVLDGDAAKRRKQLVEFGRDGTDVLIVNYEQVKPHLQALNALRFDIAIFDESHYIKSPTSQRSKACQALAIRRKGLLTGSPMLNYANDLWAPLHMIDPAQWPSYWGFVNRYAVFGGYKNKAIVGMKNHHELNAALQNVMVRRLKKDVLDLPDKLSIPVIVDLHPAQRKLYDQAKEELVLDLPDNPDGMAVDHALTKMLRLKQICGTTACIPGYADDSIKLDVAVEKIVEVTFADSPEPIVVFTQFREVQRCIVHRLRGKGIPTFEIHGDVPARERADIVNAWGKGPGVLVAMLQVAGVGLNMTAAKKAIFLDKLWVPKLNEQAEDRLHRIGASETQPVEIIQIVARNTVEQRIEKILSTKSAAFTTVVEVDDWKKRLYAALAEEEEAE